MAMAHSVEGRFPFLDYRMVEMSTRVPPTDKMKVLNEKYILKQAMRQMIPAVARTRTKQPYRAPDVDSFFSEGRPREAYVSDLLDPERIRRDRVFRPDAVAKLYAKARSGATVGVKDNMTLTAILSTQLWLEEFILASGLQSFNWKESTRAAI